MRFKISFSGFNFDDMKYVYKVLSALLIVIIIILLFQKCEEEREFDNQINYLTDSIRYYRNANGKQVAQISALKTDKNGLKLMLLRTSKQLDSLTKEFKKIDGAGEVKTITEFDTIYINYDVPVEYEFEKRFKKVSKYYTIAGLSTEKGINIDTLEIPNTLSFAIGKVKRGYEIRAVNSNPNIKVVDMDAFIFNVPKKRIGIGISAGYGVSSKGFGPYIGIGVNYNLISL